MTHESILKQCKEHGLPEPVWNPGLRTAWEIIAGDTVLRWDTHNPVLYIKQGKALFHAIHSVEKAIRLFKCWVVGAVDTSPNAVGRYGADIDWPYFVKDDA